MIKNFLKEQTLPSIAWTSVVFAYGFGLTLIATGSSLNTPETLSHTFMLAPPHIWGFAFIIASTILLVSLVKRARRKVEDVPVGNVKFGCFLLSFLICLWGMTTIPSVFVAQGAPTAAWIYLTFAVVLALCGGGIDDAEQSP